MSKTPEFVVKEQSNDDGLWFVARTAPEAYLQQELRRLHLSVETISGNSIMNFAQSGETIAMALATFLEEYAASADAEGSYADADKLRQCAVALRGIA